MTGRELEPLENPVTCAADASLAGSLRMLTLEGKALSFCSKAWRSVAGMAGVVPYATLFITSLPLEKVTCVGERVIAKTLCDRNWFSNEDGRVADPPAMRVSPAVISRCRRSVDGHDKVAATKPAATQSQSTGVFSALDAASA
ncbi:hypothetical protein JG687_00008019 [Phytophthora cactorum]|uniref:Uncharacterized protein n=1 Tax=Phytophthora cactorum TaxID=29920 RepID=A0A8T1UDI2_9STRA|nr:hypothetical protein GQ600_26795 [Phytophthora cactorum]KAG6960824.1 hypothetical protein JG687_00008019 [Phytophthora cactorum]